MLRSGPTFLLGTEIVLLLYTGVPVLRASEKVGARKAVAIVPVSDQFPRTLYTAPTLQVAVFQVFISDRSPAVKYGVSMSWVRGSECMWLDSKRVPREILSRELALISATA
jgi:hypothetical protein